MINLTGKQKRYLRSQANTLNPVFSVGKNGLNKVWLEEVAVALNKRELMKVNIQQASEIDAKTLEEFIHNNSDITVVQTIGRTLILFMPSTEDKYVNYSKEVFKIK